MNKKTSTQTGAVIYHIIVNQTKDVPKLFIKDVPDDLIAGELKSLINEGGYFYGEFNKNWCNHSVVIGLRDQDSFVRNEFLNGNVETITFTTLMDKVKLSQSVN